jgi:hypothetical protein
MWCAGNSTIESYISLDKIDAVVFQLLFEKMPLTQCVKFPFFRMGIQSIQSVKGKVVPLHSIEAHLCGRRYSSYAFLTSELEGGEWSASRPGRALPPWKEPPVPTVQEAGWAPEPVWTWRLEEKSIVST